MIIDMHCHTGSFEPVIRGSYSSDDLVTELDKAGVETAIVSNLGVDMTRANDITLAACQRHPGRILGYIYLNPTRTSEALAELERCASLAEFRAIKLHPAVDVYFPFREKYFPVYERIEQLGLPIMWHSGTYPYSNPLQIAYVALQFPKIPFILAHFGLADLARECFPAAALADNVYVDTSANPILPVMEEWLDRFGAGRMLWGSDFPFYHVQYELLKVDYLQRSEADKQCIRCENARRIFNIYK